MFMYGVDGIVHSPTSVPASQPKAAPKPVVKEQQSVKMEGLKESTIDKAALKEMAKDNIAVQDVINSMNKISDNFNNKLTYRVDERSSSGFVVSLVDGGSGDVIKEFPPEEFLEMVSRMHDFVGAFIDEKV